MAHGANWCRLLVINSGDAPCVSRGVATPTAGCGVEVAGAMTCARPARTSGTTRQYVHGPCRRCAKTGPAPVSFFRWWLSGCCSTNAQVEAEAATAGACCAG